MTVYCIVLYVRFTDKWQNRNWPDEFVYDDKAIVNVIISITTIVMNIHNHGIIMFSISMDLIIVMVIVINGKAAPAGHLPLTNCIRGAQALDEQLSNH